MINKIDSQVLINRMTPSIEGDIKLKGIQSPPDGWVLGTDVSHWQGSINWEQMANKKVVFSITKATDFYSSYAKGFVDEKAFVNLAGMRKNGIITGGYCWLQPKQDPKLQAEFYLNEFYSKADVNFPPILDFEDNNVNSWNDMLWRAQVWLEIVEEETGRTPIVYTSPGYMMNFDKVKSGFLGHYPLWIAHYIQRAYPTVPYQWEDWTIWQYSDKGHYPYYIYKDPNAGYGREYGSGSYSLDMDWFKGTKEQLDDFVKKEYVPFPEPEPEDKPTGYAKVIAWVLNVRKGPGIQHPIIRRINQGDVVPIYETKFGWVRIGTNEWVSATWVQKITVSEPEEPESLFKAKCIAYALNKREGPGTNYKNVGYLIKDDIVDVYEVKNGWYKIHPTKSEWVSSYWVKKI